MSHESFVENRCPCILLKGVDPLEMIHHKFSYFLLKNSVLVLPCFGRFTCMYTSTLRHTGLYSICCRVEQYIGIVMSSLVKICLDWGQIYMGGVCDSEIPFFYSVCIPFMSRSCINRRGQTLWESRFCTKKSLGSKIWLDIQH
jgi:hypothetical protein